MLEHLNGRDFLHQGADHLGADLDRERQGIVLNNDGDVFSNGLGGLLVIGDDLLVGSQGVGGGNHDTGRPQTHHLLSERLH